jgi:hypothetical protein
MWKNEHNKSGGENIMKKGFLVMALILIAGAGWTQTQPQTSPTSPEQAMESYKKAEKAFLDAGIEAKRANLRQSKSVLASLRQA